MLGQQRLDTIGQTVIERINNYNSVQLNWDNKCTETYTWNRENPKSVYWLRNYKWEDVQSIQNYEHTWKTENNSCTRS